MATFYQPPVFPGAIQVPSVNSQPSVQTRPCWLDQDYYRPHATSFTSSSYDYVAERVRDHPDGPPSVDYSEAKYWHRQAYQQGLSNGLSSWELGHAAAYQAHRILRDDPPVHGSSGYARENLIGLAVAEASKLVRQSGRDREVDAGTAASETAARTASRIYDQTHAQYTGNNHSRPLYRTNGPDAYGYDDRNAEYLNQPSSESRGRSRSRTPHPSFVDSPPTVVPGPFPSYYANSVNRSSGHVEMPYESPTRSASGRKYPPTPHPGSAYPPGTVVVSFPTTAASTTMLPQAYQVPGGALSTSYPSHVSATYNDYPRTRSASFSSPQQYYTSQPSYSLPPAVYPNMPYGYTTTPEQTIVIQRPKKHRHKHRHRHHRSSSR